MSRMQVEMSWDGGLRFAGENSWGHEIVTDGARAAGGAESGFKPTELLLYAVASCTGIDIVRILEKRRQKLHSLSIRVDAEQSDDYPKPFHTLRVHYIARGEALDEHALAMAISLSESKYCTVSQTLQQPTEVTTSFEIQES